jgi:hypothetical protein
VRRGGTWVALGLLLGVVAGCGGDDRSERDRAAFREFKSKTEAACEDVAAGLRRRGAPANSTDIPRLAPPAVADVHHLVAVVDRIDLPSRTERRVRPLRDDLHELDRLVGSRAAAVEGDTKLEDALDVADRVMVRAGAVASTARAMAIECWPADERDAFATALRGPLYLAWYEGLVRAALREFNPLQKRLHGTPAQVRGVLLARLRVLEAAERAFGSVKPPGWVRKEAGEFSAALARYRKLTADAARQLGDRRFISNDFAARYNVAAGVDEDTLNARTHALELRIPAEPGAAPDAIVPS